MSQTLASTAERKKFPAYRWCQVQAFWHTVCGNTDKAIYHWVQILREDSTLHLAEVRKLIKNQAFQEAGEYLQSVESAQSGMAEVKLLLGKCYFAQGLINEAKIIVEETLGLEPENAEAWEMLANCFLEQGDWQQAVQALDKAMRVAPKRAETFYRLGTIYALHGEFLEALRCFQGCCQLRPHDAASWEMKAEMHLRLNQIEQACQDFEKALRYGTSPEAAARLAYCYIQLNKIKKGIRYYEIVLKYEPDHYDALCNLAAVFQNEGRSQEAINLLDRALSINANDPILLNNLAYTLVHLGRVRKAIEYYQGALRLAPNNPMILYNLGVCYARKGNWDAGIQTLEHLLNTVPEHSEGWALLGNIYDELEKHELAIDCYNRSLKLA